jgi:predicted nucleic acid-binding protein
MSERLVFDSDVLIDHLRDLEAAAEFQEGFSQLLALSAISVAALNVGLRDGEERSRLDDFIAARATLETLNRKHFPMVVNVIVPYSKP